MTTTEVPTVEEAAAKYLSEGLESLAKERDAAIEAIRSTYSTREERIRKIIADLASEPLPTPDPEEEPDLAAKNDGRSNGVTNIDGLSAGKDKLKRVENYVKKRGSARQADIQRDLNLNSGTVSVSLRLLAEQGKMRKGVNDDGSDQKLRGSTVWFHTSPTVAKGRRTPEVAAA